MTRESTRHHSTERRNEHQLIDKATRKLFVSDDLIEKLRYLCLQRGVEGIIGFGRMFRRMDKNRDGTLSREEFALGMKETGLNTITNTDINDLFKQFDKNSNGRVSYDEFLAAIRPPLNECRLNVINAAFEKFDVTGDGIVTIDDLKQFYNVKVHPSYINGGLSSDEVLKLYLIKFERNASIDGMITRDEFIDYYSGVSASIDDDCYFDLMVRSAWKL